MKNRKKKNKVYLYLLVILGITVGFALLSTTLYINGTAAIKSNTWNIHWDENSISINQDSVAAEDPEVSTATTTDDTVSFDVELNIPGDFFEFEIDAVNEGTVDGALDLSENWITYTVGGTAGNLPGYMDFSVEYDNGNVPQSGDILKKRVDANTPGKQTYRIRVEYKSNVEELPSNPQEVTITVELPYVQHKEQIPADRTCAQFQSDSWADIQHYVSLKSDVYPLECTREIDMGTLGTHTVRISNNTIPAECKESGFSETACGFVLEFTDVITGHRMNPDWVSATIGTGNQGGWYNSDMRAFVNSGTFAYGNIDYSEGGIYYYLPSELKTVIADTKVVSSHEANVANNYISTDKLYLLSTKEVWGKETNESSIEYDSSDSATRQLDYYKSKGVTTALSTVSPVAKTGYSVFWWLRSADGQSTDDFYYVKDNGFWYDNYAYYGYGVSPAFRIG